MTELPCVFCDIANGRNTSTKMYYVWPDAVAFEPLSPVTPGHLLVVPRAHVRDFTQDPVVSALVMARAVEIAQVPCNLITSAGTEATQSIFHLHLHLVPRRYNDGLALPWYSGKV